MSKNEKKNQHYVPKCYLRNFTDGDKFIATFLHSKSKFIPKASLDSVVSEDYFYGKDLYIEKMFENYEGDWASAFRTVTKNEEVSDEEAVVAIDFLLSFIAFQHCRTLRTYDTQVDFADFLTNYIRNTSPPGPETEGFLRQYIPDDFNPMIAPIQAGFKIKDTFRDLQLLVIENKSENDFVTSDNPVVLYNKMLYERGYKGNYGLSSKGLCIFVPISPKVCFCLFDPKIYFTSCEDMVYEASDDEVHELNKLFCRNAYEYVFFSKHHTEEYARKLDEYFVDNLASQTGIAQSNLGPVIYMKGASILDNYMLNFLNTRKTAKKMYIPLYGPAPVRYVRAK